jgi:hypothetical protein
MVSPEFTPYFSVALDGAAVANCTTPTDARCINSADVATEVLSLFYK